MLLSKLGISSPPRTTIVSNAWPLTSLFFPISGTIVNSDQSPRDFLFGCFVLTSMELSATIQTTSFDSLSNSSFRDSLKSSISFFRR